MYTGVHPFLRRLHIWIGLLLLLPILLVGITAMLLAHDSALGLKGIRIESSWLPDAWVHPAKRQEIKAWLPADAYSAIIGTKSGAWLLHDNTLTPIEELAGLDIRSLHAWHGAILVASRQGGFLGIHGRWKKIYGGDAHDLTADADGNLYVAGHDVLFVSRDGGDHWQEMNGLTEQLAAMRPSMEDRQTDLKHLIKGLHSGRMLVGKRNEWLWIDAVSGLLLATALIGVFRWYRKRKVF